METPYAKLVKAARSLQKRELLQDWPHVPFEAVQEYFAINRSHLELVHEAIGQKPSFPVEDHPDWHASRCDSRERPGGLAFVFFVEVHLWTHRHDFTRAAKVGINGLDYCNALRQGGLILDALISDGCALPILQQLCRIRANLNSRHREHLIAELGRIESERESFASIEERDKRWEGTVNANLSDTSAVDRLIDDLEASNEIFVDEKKRRASTKELRAKMKDHYLFVYADELDAPIEVQRARMKEVYLNDRNGETREAHQKKLVQSDQKWPCLMRMLVVDLRLRSFKEEQGHYPVHLGQLRLGNKMARPLFDPFTGKPFVYRRRYKRGYFRIANETFDLHSPGRAGGDAAWLFGLWKRASKVNPSVSLDSANYENADWSQSAAS